MPSATEPSPSKAVTWGELRRLRQERDEELHIEFTMIHDEFKSFHEEFAVMHASIADTKKTLEDKIDDVKLEVRRNSARFQNYMLRNPALRITPIPTFHPGIGIVDPNPTLFPRHAKEFYNLRNPTTRRLQRVLTYLVSFYDIQGHETWGATEEHTSDEDEDEDDDIDVGILSERKRQQREPPPLQMEEPRAPDGATEGSDSKSEQSSAPSIEEAALEHPETAVDILEGILGLNYDNFARFLERARELAARDSKATKRPYSSPSTSQKKLLAVLDEVTKHKTEEAEKKGNRDSNNERRVRRKVVGRAEPYTKPRAPPDPAPAPDPSSQGSSGKDKSMSSTRKTQILWRNPTPPRLALETVPHREGKRSSSSAPSGSPTNPFTEPPMWTSSFARIGVLTCAQVLEEILVYN
jgi:hypothetical protein